MDEREYEIKIEREKTKQEKINALFWLGFWFLVIGGCVAESFVVRL